MNTFVANTICYIVMFAALELLWMLICYECRIHFAAKWLVTISYKVSCLEQKTQYFVYATSNTDAFVRGIKKFASKVGDVKYITHVEGKKVD